MFCNISRHSSFNTRFSRNIIRSLNHWSISNSNCNISKFWIISYFNLSKKHIHINMNPTSCNKSLFSKLFDKSSCSFLSFNPMSCILIVLYLFSKSPNFSLCFLSFFLGSNKKLWIFYRSISHYFCHFLLYIDLPFFFIC